jgi:predicted regulator of Ras-like GTPase activity (Roadblock/LC7/MglB family)
LPLNDILARLPVTVAPFLLARPGGTFSFPIREALDQLGTGMVKVRFAQLRQSALPGTFKNDSSQDDTLIDLPLQQILMALGPAAFSRRPDQRAITISEEVTAVFGPNGNVVSPPPPAPPTPAPVAVPAAVAPPAPAIAPRAPVPAAPAVPKPAEVTPIAKPPAPIKPIAPLPTTSPKLPTSAPLPFVTAKPASPLPFATRPTVPVPPPALPPPPPQPVMPVVEEGSLDVPIATICESWPETIRQEILQTGLAESSVSIPMSRLESGMKAGRVVFPWAELMGWLTTPPAAQSSQGDTILEIPLKTIAPLFMAKRRAATPQRKVFVSQSIPDLFGGLVKPAADATPASAPASAAPTPAAPVPAPGPQPDKLGELFGQPFKSEWSPIEIAQQIAALPGVSGSLLATTDGLLVAGHVPEPLSAETLAAFVPQIFSRVSGYSEETLIGTLRGITLRTDIAPCAMFRAGKLYLAVLGKRGECLPEPLLLQIASELSKRTH